MNARALLSVLFHAEKAIDVVQTARDMGIIATLDAGPVTLGELVEATGARPARLYKFLDALESLGLVVREQSSDELLAARYVSREPLGLAIEAVLGERSIERDRDTYPWREIHGRLGDVLRGRLDARFAWPPADAEQVRAFEASMAAGCAPIIEALRNARGLVFDSALEAHRRTHSSVMQRTRWLDVGGGDGAVAQALLGENDALACDVFNLSSVAPLVLARARDAGLEGRLGFVGGDFLREPIPRGYDVLSFIRVLHDWPADVARELLRKAAQALAPGGRIVVCEEFRTGDRLAVQFFWTYFLMGVDACGSRLREIEWYIDALARLGFADIQVVRGGFDLVTAVAA
jgi:demethylspheroidene O-methyltransferase